MSVRFPNATEALKQYREMEADGLKRIDLRDSKGDEIDVLELERRAGAETEEQPS